MSAATGRMATRRSSVETGTGNLRNSMMLTSGQTSAQAHRQPGHYVENTYQLKPRSQISTTSLQKILQDTMAEVLTGRDYGPEVGHMAKYLTDQVKRKARDMGVPRYKYVCLASIGPLDHACLSVTSRCLWTPATDTFAEHSFKNSSLYATAVLYAVYAE